MTCPRCMLEVDSLKTAIKHGQLISERCDSCLATFQKNAVYARKFNREFDKKEFRKDLIQRYRGDQPNGEFIRSYPEQAREQWDENTLRKYEYND